MRLSFLNEAEDKYGSSIDHLLTKYEHSLVKKLQIEEDLGVSTTRIPGYCMEFGEMVQYLRDGWFDTCWGGPIYLVHFNKDDLIEVPWDFVSLANLDPHRPHPLKKLQLDDNLTNELLRAPTIDVVESALQSRGIIQSPEVYLGAIIFSTLPGVKQNKRQANEQAFLTEVLINVPCKMDLLVR